MLAYPITVVHQVTGWQGLLSRQVHVATIAIPSPPLIFVLVASETDGHLGPQRLRPFHCDLDMAAYTVALRGRHVGAVLEAQVSPRELRASTYVRLSVTVFAPTLVVGLRVTVHALGRAGEVHRVRVSRASDAFVTRETANPLENVGTMLEGVRRFAAYTENTGTRPHREGENEQDRKSVAHGSSSVRAMRARPFHSNR
jgi:hypothetical protein